MKYIRCLYLLLVILFSDLNVLYSQIAIGSTSIDTTTIVSGLDTPWEILWGPDDNIWLTERRGVVSRLNPETGELTSYVTEFLDQGAILFRDQVKPEFLQSQIEIGSYACRNIREARQEVIRLRSIVSEIAHKHDRKIVAAGTHPFSRWEDQIITDKDRYQGLLDAMQIVARRLLIFGMHVLIGIPDPDLRVDIMNQMAYFILPSFYARS